MSDDQLFALHAGDEATTLTRYATFTRRFRAMLTDTVLITCGLALILILGEIASDISASGRIEWLLIAGLLLLYEPLLIWRRGATIGHAWNQLRVVSDRTGQSPGIGRSFARFIIKVVLGLPSFVTMIVSRRHQAVHDLLTRTTVQVTPTAELSEQEYHVERVDAPDMVLPSRVRRVVIMIAYLLGVFVAYAVAIVALDPDHCARDQSCTGGQRVVVESVAGLWLLVSLAIVVAAWNGLLMGARARRVAEGVPSLSMNEDP